MSRSIWIVLSMVAMVSLPVVSFAGSGIGGVGSQKYKISGKVTPNPPPSVKITITRSLTTNSTPIVVYTSSDGSWTSETLSNGTYTVKPEKTGYVFSPGMHQGLLNSNVTNVNFKPVKQTGGGAFTATGTSGSGGH